MANGPSIKGTIGADARPLARALTSAQVMLGKFQEKAERAFSPSNVVKGSLAIAGVTGLVVKSILNFGDSLTDTADRLGITTDALQKYRHAFAKAGTSAEQFEKGFGTLISKIDDAKQGNEAAIKTFERVGISIDDLNSMNAEAIFLKVAEGIKNTKNQAEAFAVSVELLGKAGKNMSVLMAEGAEGIENGYSDAIIASEEAIRKAGEFADKLEAIKTNVMAMGLEVLNFFSSLNLDYLNPDGGGDGGRAGMEEAKLKAEKQARERATGNKQLRADIAKQKHEEQMRRKAPGAGRNEASSALEKYREDEAIKEGGTTALQMGKIAIENFADSANAAAQASMEAAEAGKEAVKEFSEAAKASKEAIEQVMDKATGIGEAAKEKAAETRQGKIDDVLKDPQQRREEREQKRERDRAERAVDARARDAADRARRAAPDSTGFFTEDKKAARSIEPDKKAMPAIDLEPLKTEMSLIKDILNNRLPQEKA